LWAHKRAAKTQGEKKHPQTRQRKTEEKKESEEKRGTRAAAVAEPSVANTLDIE